uniref:Uncharacterized protein n=1 Tax=Panagrolaimus davidi TaxID=227884 RepID=A0A914Q6S8_9BILA
MAEVVSPNNHAASPDTSFKSVTEELQPTSSSSNSLKGDNENDVTPSKSKGTPKRKQSFGSKIASPFRRAKKDQSQSNVSKKEENPNTTCTTQ